MNYITFTFFLETSRIYRSQWDIKIYLVCCTKCGHIFTTRQSLFTQSIDLGIRVIVRSIWFWLNTCVLSHLASAIRSHSFWKTANLGSRRIASGNWPQARRTSSEICPNIMELETDELGLFGLRITLREYSLWNYIQRLWLNYFNWFFFTTSCIIYLSCYSCSEGFVLNRSWGTPEVFADPFHRHSYRFVATLQLFIWNLSRYCPLIFVTF